MYDSMVQKLGEYGVSAEKAMQILEQYGAQAGVSSAFVEEMTGKVQALGKGFSESSSTIDTSSITVKEDEDKRLGEFCKNLEMRDKILLLQCAAEVYPNIVDELYCCIVIGMSYDKMNKKKFVALDRKDFYAYRKKTLAVFRAALQACNRYPF